MSAIGHPPKVWGVGAVGTQVALLFQGYLGRGGKRKLGRHDC